MKPESHRPAGQLRGERTVRNFLFCPHYQPHSLPSSPCPGSRAHCPWLPFLHAAAKPTPRAAPQLRGEHLLSIPVALGLTRSIRIPPSTSIPEGSGAAAHPFFPQSPLWGLLPHCGRPGFCSNKRRLGHDRWEWAESRPFWNPSKAPVGTESVGLLLREVLRVQGACAAAFPPSADSSTPPAPAAPVTFLSGVCC